LKIIFNFGHFYFMMQLRSFLLFILALMFHGIDAQEYVQEIRGIVTDMHTEIPLPGATVVITSLGDHRGVATDAHGRFNLSQVPVGRHSIEVSFIGYRPYRVSNFIVSSGREVFLEIKLEESLLQIEEVTIRPVVNKENPLNEMATVSARMFTIEETDRFSGSLGDPARMASNYAGVGTLNDQSNDIVIRGNSPFGLLWMLEGVDIPNPNHFGAIGATGGPIGMLNNNTLNNSDFLTGAFPAQYGNALSGVFDLSMRQGNTTRYEFLGQVAFNGFEAGIEGPISREKHTSFLANYRYSTLGVLDLVYGIEKLALIAVPYYQDFNFNATLYRGKAGRISLFSLLGYSHISFDDANKDPDSWEHEMYGLDSRVQNLSGTVGLTHSVNFGERVRLVTSLATTGIWENFVADSMTRDNPVLSPQQRTSNHEKSFFIASRGTWKINAGNILGAGITLQPMQYGFLDSLYRTGASGFVTRVNLSGNYMLAKGYIQWKHNFTDDLSLSSGMNIMHFSASDDLSIDPRAGLRWAFRRRQALSLAGGLHGHLAPRVFYVYQDPGNEGPGGNNLGFTRSLHLVAGYDVKLDEDTRLKIEAYKQYHFNVPVSETTPGWSLLNFGAEWIDFIIPSDRLTNKGTGDNYGIELTLEKFFSRDYYYLLTASLFDSKYTGFDGISRNTAFNSNYIFNALAGKEFRIKNRNVLSIDSKIVWAGGKRFIPFTSQIAGPGMHIRIDDWDAAYAERMADYFRINIRIGYRVNRASTTHELVADLYNITNRKNIFFTYFDAVSGNTKTHYQFPFMPVMLYRVQF
jgi:hypothetical protein